MCVNEKEGLKGWFLSGNDIKQGRFFSDLNYTITNEFVCLKIVRKKDIICFG